MKPFSFLKISASLLALVAMVASTSVQGATPGGETSKGKAEVKTVVGSANVKPGDVLMDGDTVTTGPDSGVELWLGANGEIVRVDANSQLSITELSLKKGTDGETVATTKLDLKQGGLVGNVKKLSRASTYEVKHAQGVAGIRGTEYAILPGQGVVCTSGTVVVTFIVNGVPSAPITLGPNQIALPPAQPGGVPQTVTVPERVAVLLRNIARRFERIREGAGPGRANREVQVVVSALSGTSRGDEGSTPNPQ